MKEKIITLFGDSLAKGLKLVDGKPTKLETNAVEIIEKELNIDIINNSCFGQSVLRLCKKGLIDKYVAELDKEKHNIAVFNLGGNDADFDWVKVAENPDMKHGPKSALEDFSRCYDNVMKKLQNNGVEVIVCTLPPVSAELFLKNFIFKMADSEKILQYFDGDISWINRHQEIFSQKIAYLARKNNVRLIDLRLEFLKQKNLHSLYAEDGIHLNEKGQRLAADVIINFLEK